jgi:hypothetical protein
MNMETTDINQMIPQIMDALRNFGVTEHSIWRYHHNLYLSISKYYHSRRATQYSAEIMADYISMVEERFRNGEIKRDRYCTLLKAADLHISDTYGHCFRKHPDSDFGIIRTVISKTSGH